MTNNLKIIELNKRPMKGFDYSRLVLQMSGVDTSTVNTLRRLCLRDVPIYAFESSTIDIEHNDTIYNNDMMRLRISQIPVFNIKNDIVFLSQKFWKNVDFTDPKREKHKQEKKIEMYISEHNDTLINKDVFTDNIKLFVDGEQIKDPYKDIEPILITRLRPNQTFKAHCKAVLAVGEKNDIYAGASNCFFNKESDKFKLIIESQGQMDEYELLSKSCDIAIKKMKDIKLSIEQSYKTGETSKTIEITLTNEDHTIGNIINSGLQQNENVVYSGLSKPDLLIKEVKIKYLTHDKKPLNPCYQSIDNKIKEFTEIKKQLNSIGKKYIKY